ncbi:MAG: hypothetical protein A2341_09470 [Deltaproteobacteria bacterium RIFOXYB12_FULL_58_9]|nr:MAG: hypothetical protein A2341_09470 [Deltaproteobacteria bacterium RIFOXYB12_FULL_58_9]
MRRPRLVISESDAFSSDALERLRSVLQVEVLDLDRPAFLAAIQSAEILWVRLRNQVDRQALDAATRLRIIVTNTTGLNHIDLDETTRRGIEVLSLRGEAEFLKDIRATAEHTIGLMLALLRKRQEIT